MAFDIRICECSSDFCCSDLFACIVAIPYESAVFSRLLHSASERVFVCFPAGDVSLSQIFISENIFEKRHIVRSIKSVEKTQPPEDLVKVEARISNRSGEIAIAFAEAVIDAANRSEEHTSELQSLMRISYAVFCLKTKKK